MKFTELRSFLLMGAATAFACMFFAVIPYAERTMFTADQLAANATFFFALKCFASLAAAGFIGAFAWAVHKRIPRDSN